MRLRCAAGDDADMTLWTSTLPWEPAGDTVSQIVRAGCGRRHGGPALIDGSSGDATSGAQLDAQIRAIATWHRNGGHGPGATVGVSVPALSAAAPASTAAALGVLAAGGRVVLADAAAPPTVQSAQFRAAGASLVWAPDTLVAALAGALAPAGPPAAVRPLSGLGPVAATPVADLPDPEPDAPALLLFTSGATADPRPAPLTQRAAAALCGQLLGCLSGLDETSVLATSFPACHPGGAVGAARRLRRRRPAGHRPR
jgi:acyl-CoA synthetase (AMP-forming)/AMP-acid ligase II